MKSTFCPRCQQQVDSQAVTCPNCRTELKAFGHPGVPLHRAIGDRYLCDTCTYHLDDSCTYPQRPLAKECTLYDNWEEREQERVAASRKPTWDEQLRSWCDRNQGLLLMVGLFMICLIVVVSSS